MTGQVENHLMHVQRAGLQALTENQPAVTTAVTNAAVAGRRWRTRHPRKCLKQRPASMIAGRCRLRSRRSWVRIPPGATRSAKAVRGDSSWELTAAVPHLVA